jgi:acetyl-CoA carboxylase biotin carboxyl carrier protein
MELSQVKELMAELEKSKLTKLIVKKGDFEIHLEKEAHARPKAIPVEDPTAFQSEVSIQGPREAPGHHVTSPMVGTFYSSPAPDQPSFVKVGDKVQEHTVVCIIEAMKVMNEVKAGISGTVAEILADNGQPVEFGTRLFRIT